MHYIYQILAAVLIGVSIGALMHKPSGSLRLGAFIAIALGIVTLIFPSWLTLAAGAAAHVVAQFMQRDPVARLN